MSAAAAAGDPTVGLRRVVLVAAVTLGTTAYDFTWVVVSVALPNMQGTFSATPDQVAWVVTAFIIGSAMTMASVGWLTSRFGRKNLFLFALAGYTITLFGCGMATTLETEVFWRFVQGMVGAPLFPLGQAIAVDAFPPEQHGKATSFWAIGVIAGGAFGPVIGGFLIEDYGWPPIFYVTIPVGIAAFVASWLVIPDEPRDEARPLDWFGFATLMVAIAATQVTLSRGEREDWFDSPEIVVESIVAVGAVYLFVAHSLTARNPFIDLALFKNWNYALGLLVLFVFGAVIILPNVLLPLLLEHVAGYPVIEVGYVMIPRGIGVIIGLLVIGQIEHRVDPRAVLIVGFLAIVYSGWHMTQWTVEVRPWDVIWPNLMQGLASGAMWVPISTLSLGALPKRRQAEGYAIFYLQFDIGSAIGVASVIALQQRHAQVNQAIVSEAITPYNEMVRYGLLPDAWDVAELEGLASLGQEVARQAAMIAFNNSFMMIVIGCAALVPICFLFRPAKPHAPVEIADDTKVEPTLP